VKVTDSFDYIVF